MTAKQESGPRAKCDQIVYEAISKAVEIIVNGRSAFLDSSDLTRSPLRQEQAEQYNGNGNIRTNSSSRFNLFVPEVPEVRYV